AMRVGFLLAVAACGGGGETVATVAAVQVTPASAIVSPLEIALLTAQARDAGGAPLARAIAWSSSDESIATLTATGRVRALAPGGVTITATADGVRGQAALTVRDGPAARWGHAVVYDAARKQVVLFGGSTDMTFHDDTWLWDGAAWRRA